MTGEHQDQPAQPPSPPGVGGPPSGGPSGAGPRMGGGMPSGSRPSLRKAFTVLQVPAFRILWAAQITAIIGMQMQMVARGWLAFQLTGSFTALGVISMSFGIPSLLFSLVGGAIADRMDKRNLVVASQVGTGGIALLTAILVATDQINIPILFAIGLAQGTIFSFVMPARQALLVEIVPQQQFMNAVALNAAAMSATAIFAPTIAGFLIARWDVEGAYFAQVLMYGVTLLFMIRLPHGTSHLAGSATRGGVLTEIGAGLRYVFTTRILLLLMAMALIPTMLGMPYQMLLPGFAVSTLKLEPGGFGVLMGAGGVGALVGSLLIASLSDHPRKPLLQLFAATGAGLALIALGLGSKAFGYPAALVSLAVVGAFFTSYQTLNMTMIMGTTRPEFLGRVMSVFMFTFSFLPMMAGPMGLIADAVGATSVFAASGVLIVVFVAAVALLNPGYVFGPTPQMDPGDGPLDAPDGPTPEPQASTAGGDGEPSS